MSDEKAILIHFSNVFNFLYSYILIKSFFVSRSVKVKLDVGSFGGPKNLCFKASVYVSLLLAFFSNSLLQRSKAAYLSRYYPFVWEFLNIKSLSANNSNSGLLNSKSVYFIILIVSWSSFPKNGGLPHIII